MLQLCITGLAAGFIAILWTGVKIFTIWKGRRDMDDNIAIDHIHSHIVRYDDRDRRRTRRDRGPNSKLKRWRRLYT